MTTDTTTPSYTLEGLLEWLSWYQGMSVTHKIDILTVDLVVQLVDTMRDLAAANEQIEALKEANDTFARTTICCQDFTSCERDCVPRLKAEAERNARDAERGRLVVSHGSISFGPDYNTVSVRVPHVALKTVGMGSFIANVPAAIANSLDAAIAQGK